MFYQPITISSYCTALVCMPFSSDGLGRTGTFIAMWLLIEQVKAEGQIDVVGTIKSIRTQRPGAVPHLVRACDMHVMPVNQ